MTVLIGLCLGAIAFLFSAVGHGGASGYLAVMGLAGVAPTVMKPTALALNILVSAIATFKFARKGYFSWELFLPLAIMAVPCAFLGGKLALTNHLYNILLGIILFLAALQLLRKTQGSAPDTTYPFPILLKLIVGAGIGFISGLTGIGGGVFLSPILVLTRWGKLQQTAGVVAAFIWVNSVAGLLGNWSAAARLPLVSPLWAIAVVVGGWFGATYGSQKSSAKGLMILLAVVLLIASLKLVFF